MALMTSFHPPPRLLHFVPGAPTTLTNFEKAKQQLRFANEYLDLARQHYPLDGISSIKVGRSKVDKVASPP